MTTMVFIGLVLNVVPNQWSTATTHPFRDLFYSMFQFFNMLTLFCPIFCSWFCFPWISFAEMKCQCAGIEAETVCHCVAHQRLIDMNCVMHVTSYFPLQFSFSATPSPSHVVSNSLLIGVPFTPVLCTTVSAKMGISIRLCPLWLTFKQTRVLWPSFRSLFDRSRTRVCHVGLSLF